MTRLIFVTHPSVNINRNIPIDDWQISAEGIEDLRRLFILDFWKKINVLYASTELKSYAVADQAKKLFPNVKVPDDYKKENLGEVKNRKYLEKDSYMKAVENWYKDPNVQVNGWESANEAMKRISTCVFEIMEKNKNKTVVIIGHGGAGTLLACYVKSINPSFAQDPKTTGCVMVYDWDNRLILSPWQKY